jgi:hypothetical protein
MSFVIFPGSNDEHLRFQLSSIRHFWSFRDGVVPRAIVRNAIRLARKFKKGLK